MWKVEKYIIALYTLQAIGNYLGIKVESNGPPSKTIVALRKGKIPAGGGGGAGNELGMVVPEKPIVTAGCVV